MSESEDRVGKGVLAVMSLAVLFFEPVVIRDLWRWHVTPFIGIAAPDYWHAMGLSVLTGLLCISQSKAVEPNGASIVYRQWFTALVSWGAGWLAYLAAKS